MAISRTTIITFLAVLSAAALRPLQQDKTIFKALPQINNQQLQSTQPHGKLLKIVQAKGYYYFVPVANALHQQPVERYPFQHPQHLESKRPDLMPSGRIDLHDGLEHPLDNPSKTFSNLPYSTAVKESLRTNTSTNKPEATSDDVGPIWGTIVPGMLSTTVRPARPTSSTGQQVTHPSVMHKVLLPAPDTAAKSATIPIGSVRPASGSAARLPQHHIQQPQVSNATPILQNQPSRCVWAIISCCSANSEHVSYRCFEQLGCTGAFWDTSPCNSVISSSAISSANNYYDVK